MAIADGGDLVLAPSAAHFGEDPAIDDLVRKYRKPAPMAAITPYSAKGVGRPNSGHDPYFDRTEGVIRSFAFDYEKSIKFKQDVADREMAMAVGLLGLGCFGLPCYLPVMILQRTFLPAIGCPAFHSHGLDFHSRVLLCRSLTGCATGTTSSTTSSASTSP